MFPMDQKSFTWSELTTREDEVKAPVYLVQSKHYLGMYAETESDITGEIREMEDAITKMARHSTVVGDMLMSMKIHALSKNVKRLKQALAKTRPINNIV